MTKKELLSLIICLFILLVSLLVGYSLLALVYKGSFLVIGIVGLIVLVVVGLLVHQAINLIQLFQKEAEDGSK
ncbi:hypothetical protein [uncultured Sphaerochaeta sp.]|uniref:hypothetical protein n=1 Tax=uncultured Sphaerochaeta sp. TaxID=886478 RepID=UPI002A0A9CE3|nr:hypothetical protein [uncultured Sphaerochaeta sp.]